MVVLAGSSGARVLVVEDDPAIADLVKRALADAGIGVDLAATGPDGLWMASEGSYGAICLDILLPQLNGYEVCRRLRADGIEVPILILTSKTGEYDETDGFDCGADDYLRKPFSPLVLAARVRALLRRRRGVLVPDHLTRNRVSFDVNTSVCSVDDDPVELTPKERAVLEALLRSGDVPVARNALLEQVWGFGYSGDRNIVDVYIGYLRKKLGKGTIETIRGVGFRVAE